MDSGIWSGYMEKIREDPCVGPSHISLLAAILFLHGLQGGGGQVYAFAHELMSYAKISSTSTYVRCMTTLVRSRYIRYEASFDPAVGSRIYLLNAGSDLF
jgi:hypothetical protein